MDANDEFRENPRVQAQRMPLYPKKDTSCEVLNYPRLWSELSYAGEARVPAPLDSTAGSWFTFFLNQEDGHFTLPDGRPIDFAVRHPDTIDFEKQLEVVRETLKAVTDGEIAIAKYWGSGPPTKQWTPIIDRLIDTYGFSPSRAGRVLAAVHAAINDTLVVTWYYKFLWDVARPNQLDQNLGTIICTPKFPTYPSGHAAISGCAEKVLSYFFPPEADRLKELAEENALSRLYGGVHFPVDNDEGLRLGRQIGTITVGILSRQSDRHGSQIDFVPMEHRQAELPPPPYEQAIPYDYAKTCSSKLDPRARC